VLLPPWLTRYVFQDLQYKNISSYKLRIVARAESDNYRFIYAGSNGANKFEIIPAEQVQWPFGFTRRARGHELRRD